VENRNPKNHQKPNSLRSTKVPEKIPNQLPEKKVRELPINRRQEISILPKDRQIRKDSDLNLREKKLRIGRLESKRTKQFRKKGTVEGKKSPKKKE